jgi:hypothetical protein
MPSGLGVLTRVAAAQPAFPATLGVLFRAFLVSVASGKMKPELGIK